MAANAFYNKKLDFLNAYFDYSTMQQFGSEILASIVEENSISELPNYPFLNVTKQFFEFGSLDALLVLNFKAFNIQEIETLIKNDRIQWNLLNSIETETHLFICLKLFYNIILQYSIHGILNEKEQKLAYKKLKEIQECIRKAEDFYQKNKNALQDAESRIQLNSIQEKLNTISISSIEEATIWNTFCLKFKETSKQNLECNSIQINGFISKIEQASSKKTLPVQIRMTSNSLQYISKLEADDITIYVTENSEFGDLNTFLSCTKLQFVGSKPTTQFTLQHTLVQKEIGFIDSIPCAESKHISLHCEQLSVHNTHLETKEIPVSIVQIDCQICILKVKNDAIILLLLSKIQPTTIHILNLDFDLNLIEFPTIEHVIFEQELPKHRTFNSEKERSKIQLPKYIRSIQIAEDHAELEFKGIQKDTLISSYQTTSA